MHDDYEDGDAERYTDFYGPHAPRFPWLLSVFNVVLACLLLYGFWRGLH